MMMMRLTFTLEVIIKRRRRFFWQFRKIESDSERPSHCCSYYFQFVKNDQEIKEGRMRWLWEYRKGRRVEVFSRIGRKTALSPNSTYRDFPRAALREGTSEPQDWPKGVRLLCIYLFEFLARVRREWKTSEDLEAIVSTEILSTLLSLQSGMTQQLGRKTHISGRELRIEKEWLM
jgi:hypothetical protein